MVMRIYDRLLTHCVAVSLMYVVCIALLMLLDTIATGADDKADRDRKARVALALAAKPGPEAPMTAPQPREVQVAKLGYGDAYAKATSEQKPLVILVGCDKGHPVPGDVIATKVNQFGDVKGPAVVVGYPVGQSLYVDANLTCPIAPGELQKAVDAARRKIDRPTRIDTPPAPKPLDWQIRFEPAPVCLPGQA